MSAATRQRTAPSVLLGRRARARRYRVVLVGLVVLVVVAFVASLCVGDRMASPATVLSVLRGQDVPGLSFTIGQLRLPRALTGALAGLAFGMSGVIVQSLLRNALASPDIIGISAGASAAAVVAITAFGLSGMSVSVLSLVAGLATAAAIYALSWRSGVVGTRLVLIGVGVAAMLDSVIAYVLTRAQVYQVNEAMRWLTGSLNSAFWEGLPRLAWPLVVLVPAAVLLAHRLGVLQLGDELATGLGVHAERTRLALILVAVALVSVATSATGPIAFVAFLSGPIAHRLVRGTGSPVVPAGLVGAALVLLADLVAEHALPARMPVGVVTGVLGAPFLLALLARANRSGGRM